MEEEIGKSTFQKTAIRNNDKNWVWWCAPVVPGSREAETGGSLEPWDLRPVWATQQDPVGKDGKIIGPDRPTLLHYVHYFYITYSNVLTNCWKHNILY